MSFDKNIDVILINQIELNLVDYGSPKINLFNQLKININFEDNMEPDFYFYINGIVKGSSKKVTFNLFEDASLTDIINLEEPGFNLSEINFYLSISKDVKSTYKLKKTLTTGISNTTNKIAIEFADTDTENLISDYKYQCLLEIITPTKKFKFKGFLTLL